MNFRVHDWRERRNFLNQGVAFGPMQYTIANYSTEPPISKKSDLESFNEDILSKISSIPDPLKKNLADTVISTDNNKQRINMPPETKFYYNNSLPIGGEESSTHRSDFYPSITGITSFFSNFFGAITGAMFHRRPKSPASQYYDCFDSVTDMEHQMAECWQEARPCDQNKNKQPERASTDSNDNMNNCRAAVAQCEDKLNSVRSLLENKSVPLATKPKYRSRRPKRVFVEPGSVEDGFEEEFAADDYVSLSSDEYVEYYALPNVNNQLFSEIDAPKMKTEYVAKPESTDITTILPEPVKLENSTVTDTIEPDVEAKKEIISSCEDKMAKLKSLLQQKRQKPVRSNIIDSTDSVTEPVKDKPPKIPTKVIPIEKKQDKRFKNPHRLVEKRTRTKLRKNIQDDMVFAHEIDSEDISSADNSPAPIATLQRISETPIGSVESVDYFDELKGKFHSSSTTDSDDSFQIVFSDLPKVKRVWKPSDCDSEDSFIVFEDSPDSCFTSNEVFNESDVETDSDSEVSDSGCVFDVCKLSHSFSRTVSDLTDNSLYKDSKSVDVEPATADILNTEELNETTELSVTESDEVDCAVRTFEEIASTDISEESVIKPGLLIDEARKLQRKDLPAKKVRFSEEKPKVHVMRVWAFAARQARAGHWERHALDRDRFKRRIADVDMAVSWVLKPQHRSRVMFQRIMPWRNQQKRKEAAEKKQKEEEDRKREEERIEAERLQKEQESLNEVVQEEVSEESVIEDGVRKDNVNDQEKEKEEEQNKIEVIKKLKEYRKSVKKVVHASKRNCKNSLGSTKVSLNFEACRNEKEKNTEIVEINDKLTDMKLDVVKDNVVT